MRDDPVRLLVYVIVIIVLVAFAVWLVRTLLGA